MRYKHSNKKVDLELNNRRTNVAFGSVLRLLRRKKGITGLELANLLDISQQQVSRYETGICNVNVYTLVRMCSIFEISILQFIQLLEKIIVIYYPELIEECGYSMAIPDENYDVFNKYNQLAIDSELEIKKHFEY